jgi:hypothetical protein
MRYAGIGRWMAGFLRKSGNKRTALPFIPGTDEAILPHLIGEPVSNLGFHCPPLRQVQLLSISLLD